MSCVTDDACKHANIMWSSNPSSIGSILCSQTVNDPCQNIPNITTREIYSDKMQDKIGWMIIVIIVILMIIMIIIVIILFFYKTQKEDPLTTYIKSALVISIAISKYDEDDLDLMGATVDIKNIRALFGDNILRYKIYSHFTDNMNMKTH